ncbi:MAG: DUF1802 family protein [Acidobacteriota bacterium]
MLQANSIALKEWAVTVRFLGLGKQIFILRKGGIRELKEGFQPAHTEFFLFPTYVHQHEEALVPEARPYLREVHDTRTAPDTVELAFYAQVVQDFFVERLEALSRLDGCHSLNWKTVEQRFHYRGRPGLHLLVVRVYRLAQAVALLNTSAYDGCVSWVELDRAVPVSQAVPVVADQDFQSRSADLARRIQVA